MKRVWQIRRINRRLWYFAVLMLGIGAGSGVYEPGFTIALGAMWSVVALALDCFLRRFASEAAQVLSDLYRELSDAGRTRASADLNRRKMKNARADVGQKGEKSR